MTFTKLTILTAILLSLGACGDSSDDNTSMDDESVDTSVIDITNVNFTKRDGSCANYEGYYKSEVMDIKNAISFVGDVSILPSSDVCTLDANTIPNHDFHDGDSQFATQPGEVRTQFIINANPTFSDEVNPLTLGTAEAVLLNGVTLDILAAACYGVGNEALGEERIGCGANQDDNPWRYDPMSPLNGFGTDTHNAHTQPNGKYHYHGNPIALFEQDCSTATSASPVIGFAADGFPVFGACIDDQGTIREATPSFKLKQGTRQDVAGYETPEANVGLVASDSYDGQFRGDYEYTEGLGDLDECNGMTVDGQYGYYITNTFPWTLSCYKGETNVSFSEQEVSESRSHTHTL